MNYLQYELCGTYVYQSEIKEMPMHDALNLCFTFFTLVIVKLSKFRIINNIIGEIAIQCRNWCLNRQLYEKKNIYIYVIVFQFVLFAFFILIDK